MASNSQCRFEDKRSEVKVKFPYGCCIGSVFKKVATNHGH